MNDLISRQDAIDLVEKLETQRLKGQIELLYAPTIKGLMSLPSAQPTADVVEVVRCKDCRWYKSIFSWNGKEHKICVCEPFEPPREPDDYCSYGDRREDD